MENQYYNEILDIKGTADELFIQVRNGYFDETLEAMYYIQDILVQEKKMDKAKQVGYMIDREHELHSDAVYSISQAKLDFLDGGNTDIDDVQLCTDSHYYLSIRQDTRDEVLVSVRRDDSDSTAAMVIPFAEFLDMSQKDLDVRINGLIYYNLT